MKVQNYVFLGLALAVFSGCNGSDQNTASFSSTQGQFNSPTTNMAHKISINGRIVETRSWQNSEIACRNIKMIDEVTGNYYTIGSSGLVPGVTSSNDSCFNGQNAGGLTASDQIDFNIVDQLVANSSFNDLISITLVCESNINSYIWDYFGDFSIKAYYAAKSTTYSFLTNDNVNMPRCNILSANTTHNAPEAVMGAWLSHQTHSIYGSVEDIKINYADPIYYSNGTLPNNCAILTRKTNNGTLYKFTIANAAKKGIAYWSENERLALDINKCNPNARHPMILDSDRSDFSFLEKVASLATTNHAVDIKLSCEADPSKHYNLLSGVYEYSLNAADPIGDKRCNIISADVYPLVPTNPPTRPVF